MNADHDDHDDVDHVITCYVTIIALTSADAARHQVDPDHISSSSHPFRLWARYNVEEVWILPASYFKSIS
jgi:hypothetical protein